MSIPKIEIVNPGKVPVDCDYYRVQRINRKTGYYRLFIRADGSANEYITMTGSAVTRYITLPCSCRILKVGWTHTTSVPMTLSVDSLTYYFDALHHGRTVAGVRYDAYTGTAGTHYVELEDYGYVEPAEELLFSADSTNTDLLHIFMDIQVNSEAM